jgi:predicted 3-demethylubiquinone-9 3-methyltransferase (glyoxalase superfamily)
MSKQKITPFLWFDDQAEKAARFYVKLFKGKMGKVMRQGKKVLTVSFQIGGVEIVGLNGGPHYKLTPAFSLVAPCKDQKEIDRLWKALLAGGGEESRCGWLVDRFGLSWQVVPENLSALLKKPAAFQAMLAMVKLDIAALKAAR